MLEGKTSELNENIGGDGEAQTAHANMSTKRERSTIEFPYSDLDSAYLVAKAINENAGTSCTVPQLASYLQQSPNSSAIRVQISCARIFGLVERDGSSIVLTEQGKRIADPQTENAAKAEAFLAVPLFRALHQEYDGYTLPPPAALQRKIHELGVPAKQAERARQVFDRSARQAGFIAHGTGCFVTPAVRMSASNTAEGVARRSPKEGQGDGGDGGGIHPFVLGLLKALPEPNTEWKIADRAKWLRAANQIFQLMYVGEGSIRIEIEEDQRLIQTTSAPPPS